jgi:predicted RNA-binding Zn ribbon-like protein
MGRTPLLDGVSLAVELVNTISVLRDPQDFLTDLDHLRRFFRYVGASAAADAATEGDLQPVRELRERIREIMDCRDERTAASLLAGLALELDVRPGLVATESGRWEIRHGPNPNDGPAFAGPSAVYGLMELLTAGRWDRIGRCAGTPCRCVYVDRTRNRSRRYCDDVCADRVNQARTRRRRASRSGS